MSWADRLRRAVTGMSRAEPTSGRNICPHSHLPAPSTAPLIWKEAHRR